MTIASPWHTRFQGVHHNDTGCGAGREISDEDREEGTGSKPLCEECSRLTRHGLGGPGDG